MPFVSRKEMKGFFYLKKCPAARRAKNGLEKEIICMLNFEKYQPYPQIPIVNRQWPDKTIQKAPIWCSVDLRDGNQALEVPMSLEQKLQFFTFLVEMGFKEIEIGFPAASDTEFEFTRALIDQQLIPEDVTIQVLTQSREHIITKTFEALKGAKNAIVHLYNSTSTLQRDVVFGNTKEQTIDLAVFGAKMILEESKKHPETNWIFEYSPESFTGTEVDFAAEICNAVGDIWQPTPEKKIIYNLPSTVEMSTPNIYADMIEYMCNNIKNRDSVIVSVHTHNDRGTGIASTELGILAGADRVEGTLFGNGERTGNCDLVTVGLNLYTQGIDPMLNLNNIAEAISIYEKSTCMPIHPRHPYAGDLVYTAFSGSHQDAIRKGMEKMKEHPNRWEVPYLPIDPMDVGRNYDPIIRINSQSGKGGVAFVLEQNYGLHMPKAFQQDLSRVVTKISDECHSDLSSKRIYEIFNQEYVDIRNIFCLERYKEMDVATDFASVEAEVTFGGETKTITGEGNGILDAFCHAVEKLLGIQFEIMDYREHSLEYGTKSKAISYVQISTEKGGIYFGAGTSSNIIKSSLRAVASAVNKYLVENGEK